MNGSALKYWLLLAAMLATAYGMSIVWRNSRVHESAAVEATPVVSSRPADAPIESFTLTDQDGRQFDSASLRGQVWAASFFFTSCPAICWRLNRALADLQAATPESKVRYVSITCDPDNDKPEVLAKYAQHFKADPTRWTFLTGDLAKLREVGHCLQVTVEKGLHSDRVFVIDRAGRVRGSFRVTEPDELPRMKELLARVEKE